MRPFWAILAWCLVGLVTVSQGQHPVPSGQLSAEEIRLKRFIDNVESEMLANTEKATFVEWAYASNITDHNEKIKIEQQVRAIGLHKDLYINIRTLIKSINLIRELSKRKEGRTNRQIHIQTVTT